MIHFQKSLDNITLRATITIDSGTEEEALICLNELVKNYVPRSTEGFHLNIGTIKDLKIKNESSSLVLREANKNEIKIRINTNQLKDYTEFSFNNLTGYYYKLFFQDQVQFRFKSPGKAQSTIAPEITIFATIKNKDISNFNQYWEQSLKTLKLRTN